PNTEAPGPARLQSRAGRSGFRTADRGCSQAIPGRPWARCRRRSRSDHVGGPEHLSSKDHRSAPPQVSCIGGDKMNTTPAKLRPSIDTDDAYGGEWQRIENRRRTLGLQRGAAGEDKAWGLALSGGGIRSATFCLGVLQALARASPPKSAQQ